MVTSPGRAAMSFGIALTVMAAVAMSPATPPAIVQSIGGSPSTSTWSRGDSAPTYICKSRLIASSPSR